MGIKCPECGRERETSAPFDGEIARGVTCGGPGHWSTRFEKYLANQLYHR